MKKIVAILLVLLWTGVACGSAGDDISKNVNSLIRTAEKMFFDGKPEEAAKLLEEAQTGLDRLKDQDAGHRSLKTLQTKHDRLKVRVEKKLGGTAATTKTAPSSAPPKTPASGGEQLSHGAKSNLQKAARAMDFAEKELADGEQKLSRKEYNLVKSSVFNTSNRIEEAAGYLDRAVKNNKANPEHPELIALNERLGALSSRRDDFKRRAESEESGVKQAAAAAAEEGKAINDKWVHLLVPYTTPASGSYMQYPGSYDVQLLEKQEALYSQARDLLSEVESAVPVDKRPQELNKAIENLAFALQVYDDQKAADGKNRLQPIESTLSQWEERFAENRKWEEDSDTGLFVITPEKLSYQQKQIAELKKTDAANGAAFEKRLEALEKENSSWTEKKKKWMERPRPFPAAKMVNKKLASEAAELLENSGMKVLDLVITDKDWWVLAGEYRYMGAAVLSKDKEGKFWSNFSFRQMQTLTGYGPTELMKVDEIRIRLP